MDLTIAKRRPRALLLKTCCATLPLEVMHRGLWVGKIGSGKNRRRKHELWSLGSHHHTASVILSRGCLASTTLFSGSLFRRLELSIGLVLDVSVRRALSWTRLVVALLIHQSLLIVSHLLGSLLDEDALRVSQTTSGAL